MCRFAHDYVFTPQLLVQLRRELKGILCTTARKGICINRYCIYGHLDTSANRSDVDLDDSSQASFRVRNISPLTVQSDGYNESSIPLTGAPPLRFGTPTYTYPLPGDSRSVELFESSRNSSTTDVFQNPESPIPQTSEPPPRAFVQSSVRPPRDVSSFDALLRVLQELRQLGFTTPLRAAVGERLKATAPEVYRQTGVASFKAYVELAEKGGFVVLLPGKIAGSERIALVDKYGD